ncbi:MAG: beta-galactosidase [Clostridiales bacterium]|nr:beta-galactosidase [Clostridiales bacterium]
MHNADTNIYFTASGVGSVLAVGSGNPVSEEMYVGNQRRIYQGRAMVVVRANGEVGNIVLTASAEGIPSTSIVIEVA